METLGVGTTLTRMATAALRCSGLRWGWLVKVTRNSEKTLTGRRGGNDPGRGRANAVKGSSEQRDDGLVSFTHHSSCSAAELLFFPNKYSSASSVTEFLFIKYYYLIISLPIRPRSRLLLQTEPEQTRPHSPLTAYPAHGKAGQVLSFSTNSRILLPSSSLFSFGAV